MAEVCSDSLSLWSCTIERAYLEPTLQLLCYKLFLKVRHHSSRSTPGPGPSRSGFGIQRSNLPRFVRIKTVILQQDPNSDRLTRRGAR